MKFKIIFLSLACNAIVVYSQSSMCEVKIMDGFPSNALKLKIENNATNLLSSLSLSHKQQSETIFFGETKLTEEARTTINKIWESSRFYPIKTVIKENLLKTNDGYEIRNIPINIEGREEEIVLVFNTQGTVADIYFSVGEHQYKNVSTQNTVIDETRKNIIRNFLEALKTAYVTKNIEDINKAMSDKALILVGRKLTQSNKNSFKLTDTGKYSLYTDGAASTYKKMTKAEYLNGLKRVFNNNRNILVHFENIEIIPHRKKGYESYYGVRLKQKWQTDNYSDNGLLFFVIEFREKEPPLIWVRVWQDADTTPTSEQIGLGEIQIQPN